MSDRCDLDGLVARATELGRRWRDDGAVEEIVSLAGGRRGPLEAARDTLVARLHREPGDVAATQALCLVLRALDRAQYEVGV
jgi:hypothetical protein